MVWQQFKPSDGRIVAISYMDFFYVFRVIVDEALLQIRFILCSDSGLLVRVFLTHIRKTNSIPVPMQISNKQVSTK